MMRPPATVVIPVWNAWEHTRRCLDSLRPTLGLRDKVVVVDNGSSDATAAELARRPWLTVISNAENRGFAAACNQGAAAATTDIVVFLNNDTLTPSRWIDALLAPLADAAVVASGPRSNAVSGPQLVADARYDGSKLAEVQRFARTWRETNTGTTDVERLVGFCLAVKASAFAEVGGFDERFEVGGYEDDDLCQRLRDAGGRLVIAHASFVHHVGHQTFDANDVDWFELQERNRTVLAAKHADEAATAGVLVSACLIVRDEATNIRPCLDALKDFVDEVVIYDTGSIDGTPELAQDMGATVIRGFWDDDFARARNTALAACKGTWILWIDADELVVCADPVEVRSRLSRSTGCDGYKINIANAVGDGSGARTTFDAARLFRRKRARWSGRVHEQLVSTDPKQLVWRDGLALTIDHQGYLDAVVMGRRKSERNLRLVELALAEQPDDALLLLDHGRTLLLLPGQQRRAMDQCAKVAVRRDVDDGLRRRAFRVIAQGGLMVGAYDEAAAAIASLRELGGADAVATVLASRHAVAVGDMQRALDELDLLRPGMVDFDGRRLLPAEVAEVRARALYGMNRPGAAADALLEELRQGRLERGSVRDIAIYSRWGGRSLDDLVASAVGDYRLVLLATAGQLHPPAAADLLEALWRNSPGDLAVLVAAAGAGSRMSVETALVWSERLRSRGLAEHCPLVAVAGGPDRSPQDRFIAGALASAVFGDDRALAHLGRAAAAVPALERPALLATLHELCPAALPLAQAVYEPQLPPAPMPAYLCSIVLPMTDDLAQGIAAIQALAGSSTGEQAEVVVVSDGMDPAREQLLQSLGGDVRVVRLPVETGLAHAFNVGIAAAAGDVVVLMHPAVLATAGWLQVVMDAVGQESFVEVGAETTGPAVVAASRAALAVVAGADSRLADDAVLPDLVLRLRESGVAASSLPSTLVGWQPDRQPTAGTSGPAGRPLWDRVSLPAKGLPVVTSIAERSGIAPRVRVHGFLNGELGLGEAARGMVRSLVAAGVEVATESYSGHLYPNEHPFEPRPEDGTPYDINLVYCDASPPAMLSNARLSSGGRHTIGLWYWELETVPAWMLLGLQYVDEVWVVSDFIRDALSRVTRVPVLTVPPPVATHEGRPGVTRAEVGLPAGFVFGFMFDHNSTMARKNPLGLVEAFCAAFAPGEGPQLVIKAINGAQWPENHDRLVRAAAQHPDVHLLEDYLPSEANAAFTGLVDCWVSLHRSEGFGLTMAEAMGWGTPVVGTAYSGNLDYMDDSNSYLVPYEVGSVPPGVAAYSEGELWAEPDLEAAARILREVWSDPEAAAGRGERGRSTIRERYSADAIGAIARARLDVITAGLRTGAQPRLQAGTAVRR